MTDTRTADLPAFTPDRARRTRDFGQGRSTTRAWWLGKQAEATQWAHPGGGRRVELRVVRPSTVRADGFTTEDTGLAPWVSVGMGATAHAIDGYDATEAVAHLPLELARSLYDQLGAAINEAEG